LKAGVEATANKMVIIAAKKPKVLKEKLAIRFANACDFSPRPKAKAGHFETPKS